MCTWPQSRVCCSTPASIAAASDAGVSGISISSSPRGVACTSMRVLLGYGELGGQGVQPGQAVITQCVRPAVDVVLAVDHVAVGVALDRCQLVAQPSQAVDARGRLGAEQHQVAAEQQTVEALGPGLGQHRVERRQVAVDVEQDCVAHGRPLRLGRCISRASSAQRGQATCVSSPTMSSSSQPAGAIAAWSPCCVVVAPHRHVYTAQTYG